MSNFKYHNKILNYLQKDKTRALYIKGKRGSGKTFIIKDFFSNSNFEDEEFENLHNSLKEKYSGYKIINAYKLNSKTDLKDEFSKNYKLLGTNEEISDFQNISNNFLDRIIPIENPDNENLRKFLNEAEKHFQKLGFLGNITSKITDRFINGYFEGLKIDTKKDITTPFFKGFKNLLAKSYYDNILEDKILIIDEVDRIQKEDENRDSDVRLIDIFNCIIDIQEKYQNIKIIFILADEHNPNDIIFESWKSKIFSHEIEIISEEIYKDFDFLEKDIKILKQIFKNIEDRRVFEKFLEFDKFINNYLKEEEKNENLKINELKSSILYEILKFYNEYKEKNEDKKANQKIEDYVKEFINLEDDLLKKEIDKCFNKENEKITKLEEEVELFFNEIYHSNISRSNSYIIKFIKKFIENNSEYMNIYNYNSHNSLSEYTILHYLEYLIDKKISNNEIFNVFSNAINKNIENLYEKLENNNDIYLFIQYLEELKNIIDKEEFNKYLNNINIESYIFKSKNNYILNFKDEDNKNYIDFKNKNKVEEIFNYDPDIFLIELFKQIGTNHKKLIEILREINTFNKFEDRFLYFLENNREKGNYKIKDNYNDLLIYFKDLSVIK